MPTLLIIDDNPAVATALEVLFSLHDIATLHAQTPEAILAPKIIPAEELRRCEETGTAIAAGMAMGIF